MLIQQRNHNLIVDDSLMRLYIAQPAKEGKYPGILFYSDIYQLGGPITRLADRLAGYGYVVAAPEIFHHQLPIGSAIDPTDLGRMQGNEAARKTTLAEFDSDARAVIDFLSTEKMVESNKIASMGFCIGGHLSFRAALIPEVKSSVCCYPTGVHNGKLGKEKADTLERIKEIQGEILLIFGSLDPHVPEEGRKIIMEALDTNSIKHQVVTYEANHTFMRDDGYRFDPVATDLAWGEIISFLQRIFA